MVNKNLILRVFSSLILAPLVLSIIYFNNIIFDLMMFCLAGIMFFEWYELTVRNNNTNPNIWRYLGLLFVGLPCTSLVWIIDQQNGNMIVSWIVLVVWATDVFAFFSGKILGGKKLAPKISPNKTWAGLIGGMFGAAAVGYFMEDLIFFGNRNIFILLNMLLAVYAQIGDLLESWIKRKFNFKDSGSIIPGHGGILDRVDGLTLVAPKIVFLMILDPSLFL